MWQYPVILGHNTLTMKMMMTKTLTMTNAMRPQRPPDGLLTESYTMYI